MGDGPTSPGRQCGTGGPNCLRALEDPLGVTPHVFFDGVPFLSAFACAVYQAGALAHLAHGSTGIVEGPLATACASKDYNPTRHSFPFDIALS
jgi:hypothetical protein